jgi:hypothetical protein
MQIEKIAQWQNNSITQTMSQILPQPLIHPTKEPNIVANHPTTKPKSVESKSLYKDSW